MKTLLIISIFFAFAGCATIPKYSKTDFVALIDVKEIEGEYNNYPDNSTRYEYETINSIINRKADKTDTSKIISVTIKADEKTLEFYFHKTSGQITSRKIRYKLKDNGFLYLNNRNFRLTGLPYIFGGYDLKKTEVGLTNQKDLIINGIEKSEGAILIVLGSGFPKHNFKYTYKRSNAYAD